MEWQLPIQKIEISNINIGSPWARGEKYMNSQQKPMVPLSYFGTQFRMPFLSVLFPALQVIEYNQHTGRLVLDMASTNLGCIKLNTLQETIINAIVYHQQSWFRSEFSKEEVRNGFQPIIEGHNIILHCPAAVKNVFVYKNGQQIPFTPNDLKPGVRVRVGTKILGISFLTKPGDDSAWSGKCRIQHKIQGIIYQND